GERTVGSCVLGREGASGRGGSGSVGGSRCSQSGAGGAAASGLTVSPPCTGSVCDDDRRNPSPDQPPSAVKSKLTCSATPSRPARTRSYHEPSADLPLPWGQPQTIRRSSARVSAT